MPDRWEDYSNIGTLVEGTSFLAFKVPLKAALLAQVSLVSDRSIWNCIYCGHLICNIQVSQKEKRSWSVSDLLTSCPSLALVIDLTNTYRLYNFLLT